MDISRQQFEGWFNSGHGELPYSEKGKGDLKTLLLQSWQASRESLVVELPLSQRVRAYDYYTDGYNSGVDCCEVILESAGIKVIRTDQ